MHTSKFLLAACLLAAGVSITTLPLTANAAASADYDLGKLAFREGDYALALSHFSRAEQTGEQAPSLYYNLGVTHYKLGDFPSARLYFEQLLAYETWTALAILNLGAVTHAEGKPGVAKIFFRDALQQTDSDKLKTMIRGYLGETEENIQTPTKQDVTWTRFASLAYGYDENPALIRDDIELPDIENTSDRFTESAVHFGSKIPTTASQAFKVSFTGYSRNLASSDKLDFTKYLLNSSYDFNLDSWTLTTGIKFGNATLDTSQYLQDSELYITTNKRFKHTSLHLDIGANSNEGGSGFHFLDGWQHDLKFELKSDISTKQKIIGQWSIYYRYENNDRADIKTTDRFISFSPQRSILNLKLKLDLTEKLSTTYQVQQRESWYADRIRISPPEQEPVLSDKRRDKRRSMDWSFKYDFTDRFHGVLTARYIENISTIEAYDYDSSQANFGFEYQF
ncbi:MAG: tetratricopeptide repeat protein [Spongiibacteraceae bacterium]